MKNNIVRDISLCRVYKISNQNRKKIDANNDVNKNNNINHLITKINNLLKEIKI